MARRFVARRPHWPACPGLVTMGPAAPPYPWGKPPTPWAPPVNQNLAEAGRWPGRGGGFGRVSKSGPTGLAGAALRARDGQAEADPCTAHLSGRWQGLRGRAGQDMGSGVAAE
jgi:hypothetical protein